MYRTEELYKIINNQINSLKFPSEPTELYDPVNYTLALGGKRLRPLLMLMACNIFEQNVKKALPAAMAIEIFHNFTLLHDDIMDNAPIRRGKATVYKKWNSNIAILSGDTMQALAFKYLTQTESIHLKEILETFTDTAIQVCEGQQYDLNFETMPQITIDDYINMIRLKTAVLIASALKIGAIIGGAGKEAVNNLYQFGENIGIAFQLMDDLLDIYSDESKFGKQNGGDIVSNKKTFLYLRAFELASGSSLNSLKDAFTNHNYSPEKKIDKVKKIYNRLKVREHTETEITRYYSKGISFLESLQIDTTKKAILKDFTHQLMQRDY